MLSIEIAVAGEDSAACVIHNESTVSICSTCCNVLRLSCTEGNEEGESDNLFHRYLDPYFKLIYLLLLKSKVLY